ncbi:MAG: VWA domain-containing protein [Bryobacteraceae bacterium]|nr:VWA domain-containing protein [Bryobacteraceae bacterium]
MITACLGLVYGAAGTFGAEPPGQTNVERKPRAAKRQVSPPPSLRADVRLVLTPVTVTDLFGAPVSGLPAETFQLFEEGVEQDIRYFSSDEGPVSLGIVFDASRSMTGKLERSRAAVTRFCYAAAPDDEFFLIEFNDTPRVLFNFTSDPAYIEKAAMGITPRNWTALFDAVYMAIAQMKNARHSRKALLILSDGGDNRSRYSEREMRTFVREGDVSIYSIGLFGGKFLQRHESLLRRLSDETGGTFYQVEDVADLPEVVATINETIRRQYVLGHVSANAEDDGAYRKIEVRLRTPPAGQRLRASWRTGYYAPDTR